MKPDWEVLGQLIPLQWRGIEVPCVKMSMACSNRTTEHEQYDVPGADVENGNRKAVRHTFVIPFRRMIAGYVNLYPKTFRLFIKALLDPDAGPLQHPEFGEADYVVVDWSVEWTPDKRDGADLTVTYVETNENGVAIENATPSMVDAQRAALDLQQWMTEVDPPIEDPSPSELSLDEQLAQIASLKLLAELRIAEALAGIEQVIDRINGLLDVIGGSTDPLSSEMYAACVTIGSACAALKENLSLAGAGKKIRQRINDKQRSVADAAAHFAMSTGEFYQLNPALGRVGKVGENEAVLVFEGR